MALRSQSVYPDMQDEILRRFRTYSRFSRAIGYDSAHFRRVMRGLSPLSNGIKKRIDSVLNDTKETGAMPNKDIKSRITDKFGTYTNFADILGVSSSHVSNVTLGNKELSKKKMPLWAALLDCKVVELFPPKVKEEEPKKGNGGNGKETEFALSDMRDALLKSMQEMDELQKSYKGKGIIKDLAELNERVDTMSKTLNQVSTSGKNNKEHTEINNRITALENWSNHVKPFTRSLSELMSDMFTSLQKFAGRGK